ncbi:Cytochrome c7 c [uncultured archaeon]|nr:Cytochrome c7 c [uncultured archaeon]
MNAKLSLALIALVGVGVFALPSTMALFSGQHSFYNIDATGNQIPCQKCHGDVKAELNSGLSTVTGTKGPHADFQCEYCHRSEAGMASGDNAIVKLTYANVTGPAAVTSVYVATTIQNYETGNFPKQITGVGAATKTISDWSVFSAKNLDLTTFVEKTDYRDDRGFYAGQITAQSAGILYNFSRVSETATFSNGAPLDQNTSTQNNAVDPSAVTISGTGSFNFNGSGSREVTPGTRYHAASLVSCMECHGGEQEKGVAGYEIGSAEPYMHSGWLIDPTNPNSGCQNCHYSTSSHTPAFEHALEAGGFGLTKFAGDTGSVEAHNAFVKTNDGINRFGYGASNGACIACHTHVAVDINFQKGYKLSFSATESSAGQYSVGNFAVEGNVNIAVYGNGSGQTFATGNKTYSWTPGTNLYINGSGAKVVGLGTAGTSSSDSATALTTGQ